MFTKKIASFVLAGVMITSGASITAFASEEKTGMTLEEFRTSGMTLEGLKSAKGNLEERGITLEEAKANIGQRIEEFASNKGITVEEAEAKLAEFKESGKSVEGLQNIKDELESKGLTLEDAKLNFQTKLNEFATAGGISLEEAQAIIAGFKADGKTFESLNGFKAELEAQGITLDEAKANFEGMFNEFLTATGLTADDAKAKISEMKANGRTFDGLKNIQDIIGNIPS